MRKPYTPMNQTPTLKQLKQRTLSWALYRIMGSFIHIPSQAHASKQLCAKIELYNSVRKDIEFLIRKELEEI